MTLKWEQIQAIYRSVFGDQVVGEWDQECPLCPARTQGGMLGLEAHINVCHPDYVLDNGDGGISG